MVIYCQALLSSQISTKADICITELLQQKSFNKHKTFISLRKHAICRYLRNLLIFLHYTVHTFSNF